MDKSASEEAHKELCKTNPEQLFKEVVTEFVDQRMKMEDDESKKETGKGIPWLIESLKEKQKAKKWEIPQWRRGAERSEIIQGQQHGKRKRTEQLSKQIQRQRQWEKADKGQRQRDKQG